MNEFSDLYSIEGVRIGLKEPEPLPWERVDVEGLTKWTRPGLDDCEKFEDAALANALIGEMPTPESALADTHALTEFRKVFPLPSITATFTAPRATAEVLKLAHRVQCETEHKAAVGSILAKFRSKIGGAQDAWDRLARSCETFISSTLLAAIGEN